MSDGFHGRDYHGVPLPPPTDPPCSLKEFKGNPDARVFDAPGELDGDVSENELALAAMVRSELLEFLISRHGRSSVEVLVHPDHTCVFSILFDAEKEPMYNGCEAHVRIVLEPGWIHR